MTTFYIILKLTGDIFFLNIICPAVCCMFLSQLLAPLYKVHSLYVVVARMVCVKLQR